MRSPASRPAPNAASASAPRLASLSTITGMSSLLRISVAAVMPIHPGRIALEPTVPASCSIGPGRPIPAPITALRGTPASASASATISAASSRPCWASWSVSSGSRRSERIVLARSETATRRCEWPKSMPIAAPAEASKESRIGGRPPCWPWAEPGSGRSTTRPSAWRSATRLETVERLSPVRRAISAREIVPSSRSARITRRRLRRLRDSREPARPCGMDAPHWTGWRQVCQCFERTCGHLGCSAPRFRREELLEEVLVALVGAGARHARSQAARELGGECMSRLGRELVAAGQIGAHDRKLVIADAGGVERSGVAPGHRDVGRGHLRTAIADHQRAGGVVAEPLVVARGQDRDDRRDVERREALEQPDDVADEARPESHRPACVHHHSHAGRALAGRPASSGDLEDRVVAEDQQHAAGADDRRAELAAGHEERDDRDRDRRDLDQRVEQQADEARADAGQRQLEVDPFRRGDRAAVLILHGALNLERFQSERRATWEKLEAALNTAGDRPERLGADGVRELGTLYRGTAADLAFARRRFPRDPVTGRLDALVLRARATVYARSGRRASLWSFLSRGYWVRIAERPVLVLAAWAVLLVPAAGAAAWAAADPGAAA